MLRSRPLVDLETMEMENRPDTISQHLNQSLIDESETLDSPDVRGGGLRSECKSNQIAHNTFMRK